jgi:hypothetical protein
MNGATVIGYYWRVTLSANVVIMTNGDLMVRKDRRSAKEGGILGLARRRSLGNARERLTWLLEFASRAGSIAALSSEELQRLRSRVWAFPERMMTTRGLDDLSTAQLARLAGEVAHGVRVLIRGEAWRSRTRSVTLHLHLRKGRAIRRYIAEHSDGFLIEAHELIAAEAKRLRQCPRSDCGKIFVANKRQIFCSFRCSQNERTERFLATHSEEELREKRHARYFAWIQRTKGPAVAKKIRRRF